jgi:hypothetical protein
MVVALFPAPMSPRSPVRRLIERMLPWYDPTLEQLRDRRTEAVRRRAIAQRIRVERVISQYHEADERARGHTQKIIDQYRLADDDRRER